MLGLPVANLNKFQSEMSESHLGFRTDTPPVSNSEVLVFDPIRSVLKWILNSVCACETAEDGVQQQDLRNMIMHLQQIF